MYCPERYTKKDKKYIYDFLQHYPFATMVLQGESLLATHIPVLTKGGATDFYLYSHIGKSNPQCAHLADGLEALFIFQSPHAYISSSWYNYDDISTWDYGAVHIHAKIYKQTAHQLETSLQELVYYFEKDQKQPKYYQDLPPKLIQEHLPQITGFTAKPTKIEAIAKYHQDFDEENIQNICHKLTSTRTPMNELVAKQIKKEYE
jgi:transcriptional regulator